MTDQEIQQLARECVIQLNGIEDYMIESMDEFNIILSSLQWLSSRYCIVEKSKVKQVMKYPQRYTEPIQNTMHFQTLGIKKVLTTLFGKELFTDTEQ